MKKRRVTLNLDEDVVAALGAAGGRSMSDVANRALRDAMRQVAHRAALGEWIAELNEHHGAPTDADYAWAEQVLAEAFAADEGSNAA